MGILPMAIVTLAISGLLWGGLVYLVSGRSARYLWVMLLGLPLSAAGNILIKGPLALGVAGAFALAPPSTPGNPSGSSRYCSCCPRWLRRR